MREAIIDTWREGPMVRTEVWWRGKPRDLPWVFDCFTHRGARRKARRTIRRWQRRENPTRLLVLR